MEQNKINDLIYAKLPPSTRDVIMGPVEGEDTEYNIVKFVQNLLPKSEKEKFHEKSSEKFRLTTSFRKTQPRRLKKTLLSAKERRQLGLYNLRRNDMKYKDFLPLHNLWTDYFVDYMEFDILEKHGFVGEPGDTHWENVSHKLMKADYHGSLMTVSKCLCPSLVGRKGIVVFDTKNTFQMIGEDNVLRIIPKAPSVFKLSVNQYTFTILGNQFCIKPTARNAKKLKTIIDVDL